MSEWCCLCGEGADTVDEIIHDFGCANELTSLDDGISDDDLDDDDDFIVPPDLRHVDCTHRRSWRSDEKCERRKRQARAAQRALGGP